jgi:hypothetical protein
VHGTAEVTVSQGKVVWQNGNLDVEAGSGKFVPINPFCEHVFASIPARQKVL